MQRNSNLALVSETPDFPFQRSSDTDVAAYLRSLDITVLPTDPRINALRDRFAEMAAFGYDLAHADGTVEIEARQLFAPMPKYWEMVKFDSKTEGRYNAAGEFYYASWVNAVAKIGGKNLTHADESLQGPVKGMVTVMKKIIAEGYEGVELPHLKDYGLKPLNTELQEEAALVRVTIGFSVATKSGPAYWRVQHISPDKVGSSFEATLAGMRLALFKQGIAPR